MGSLSPPKSYTVPVALIAVLSAGSDCYCAPPSSDTASVLFSAGTESAVEDVFPEELPQPASIEPAKTAVSKHDSNFFCIM